MSKQENKGLVPVLRFPEFRGAGEWEGKKIGQISETVTAGGTPSTSEKEYWGGGIRWMNSGELNYKRVHEVQGRITENGLRNSSTKIIPKMCILIGLAGQGKTRGTVAMNMVELCINQSIAAIFPNEDSFYSDFLYHNLNNRYDELRSLSAGGEGRGGLNLQIIKSLRVPLPSLKEQQKIADCLTFVDDLITAQTQKLDALKTHKKGLMQQLFPAEGETVPKLRFPEFRDKGEWEYMVLDPFLRGYTERVPSTTELPIYSSTRIGLRFQKDYYDNRELENEGEYGLVPSGYFVYRHMSDDGTFKFNINKTGGTIAVSKEYPVFTTVGLHSDFLLHLLNEGERFKAFALAQKKGGTRTRLYLKVLRCWKALLPSYLEQQKIADCLTSIDELIAAQTQKLNALKAHKKGLMQQLFPAMDDNCVDAGSRAAQDAKAGVSA